jgi:putative ABC transport system substrate-binding protein
VNNRRKVVIAFGAGALAAPFGSFAQQQGKLWRIGFLDGASAVDRAETVEAMRAGLRDLGYIENKNILIEFRWAEGKYERLPALAAELAGLKVDVLVAQGTPCTIAAKQATSTIPIVMVGIGDPIAAGLVTSLARPTGNVTGVAILEPDITVKRLELVHDLVPRVKQVAIFVNPSNPGHANIFKAAEIAARSLKMGLQRYAAANLDDIKSAFATMAKKGAGAIVIPIDTMFPPNFAVIAVLAEQQRLPTFGPPNFPIAGGLIGYGANSSEFQRRSAYYIDKILKGVKPADIPVEQPTKFEMVVNMRTAKALGIKIPPSIMVRATKVIQ